jgi:hypothetical protein
MNSITASDIACLTDDRLIELGERLEKLAWQLVRRPAHDPAYQRVESLICLVEAEEDRRNLAD